MIYILYGHLYGHFYRHSFVQYGIVIEVFDCISHNRESRLDGGVGTYDNVQIEMERLH